MHNFFAYTFLQMYTFINPLSKLVFLIAYEITPGDTDYYLLFLRT